MSKRSDNLSVVVIVENLLVVKNFDLSRAAVFDREVKIMRLKTKRGTADGSKEPLNIDINTFLIYMVSLASSLSTGGMTQIMRYIETYF